MVRSAAPTSAFFRFSLRSAGFIVDPLVLAPDSRREQKRITL
jgi:hypothetical protein